MEPTELTRLTDWAARLRIDDVPGPVRQHAKNQVFSMLAAVHAGYSSDLGRAIEASYPRRDADPISAAALMSAWSMTLDFDDVMLGGHTGHSSVLVPAAFAGVHELSGGGLLLAQIAANEIAARLNMAAALGPTRGQMAARLHLAGAATARAKAEGLPAGTFAHALAIALSYPTKACYAGFMGSDAKVLSAAWPIRWGLEAVDAARAGLRGNLRILEDGGGFFDSETPCPLREFLGGLGTRWHTETNSYKTHPGSAYLQAAVQAAETLSVRVRAGNIRKVEVFGPALMTGMEQRSRPYRNGGGSAAATLSFSTAYAVACALVFGSFGPEHLKESAKNDPRVWQMVDRIEIRHDARFTIDTLRAPIPLGAALSNTSRLNRLRFLLSSGGHTSPAQRIRLSAWDKIRIGLALCRPAARHVPDDFAAMTKALPARVVIQTTGGSIHRETVTIPDGFAGHGDWSGARALMRAKYIACATETIGAERAHRSAAMLDGIEHLNPTELPQALALNDPTATEWADPALEIRR